MQSYFLKTLLSVATLIYSSNAANAQFAAMNAIRIDVNMGGFTKQALNDARESDKRVSEAQSRISVVNLIYKSSLSVRKRNLVNFVAKTRKVDPAGANQLEEMFATTDVIAELGKAMNDVGLRPDNLADAYTVYWSSAWHASVGSTKTPSREQFAKIKAQATAGLLANPSIVSASGAAKQEFAEALLVQAALIDASIEAAQSNSAQLKAVSKAVQQGAQAMGLDLYAMTLTEDGFVPAKKGSAVDNMPAAPGEENTPALASNIPPVESPNYALIAAAGGAGLGGMFLLGKAMGRKS